MKTLQTHIFDGSPKARMPLLVFLFLSGSLALHAQFPCPTQNGTTIMNAGPAAFSQTINTNELCEMAFTTDTPWLHDSVTPTGVPGVSMYSIQIDPNQGGTVRNGSYSVTYAPFGHPGNAITVTTAVIQNPSSCSFQVSPAGLVVPASGSPINLEIIPTGPSCWYNYFIHDPTTGQTPVSNYNLTGTSTVTGSLPPNGESGPWSWTISVYFGASLAQDFTFTQAGGANITYPHNTAGSTTPFINAKLNLPTNLYAGQYSSNPLTVSGGVPPYSFAISGLPAGLNSAAAGGTFTISGTPAQSGFFNYLASVSDSVGQTASVNSWLDVGPGLQSISPASAPAGGDNITLEIGGAGFSASTVALWNGQPLPTMVGSNTHLTATVTADKLARPGTAYVAVSTQSLPSVTVPFVVSEPVQPVTSTSPLSGASSVSLDVVAGRPASFQSTVTGGTAPYKVAVAVSQQLPPGLSISSTGVLSGTSSTSGSYRFEVITMDSGTPQQHVSQGYEVNVSPAITSVYPTQVMTASSDTTVSVEGAGFTGGSVATVNGTPVSAEVVSPSNVRVVIPGYMLKSAGIRQIALESSGLASNVANVDVEASSLSLSWYAVNAGTVSPTAPVKIPDIVVSTSPSQMAFVAGVEPGCPWLVLSTNTGVSPQSVGLRVGYSPLPGQYTCKVSFSSPGGPSNEAVVSVTVPSSGGTVDSGSGNGVLFDVMPNVVTLIVPSTATEAAHTVRLYIAGSETAGDQRYNASVEGDTAWLSIESGADGSVPGVLELKVLTEGLGVGSYNGVVRVFVPGLSPQTVEIPVELSVSGATSSGP